MRACVCVCACVGILSRTNGECWFARMCVVEKKFIALHQDAAMAVVKEMKVTAISQLDEGNSCSCNLQSKKSLPKPLKPPLKKSKD